MRAADSPAGRTQSSLNPTSHSPTVEPLRQILFPCPELGRVQPAAAPGRAGSAAGLGPRGRPTERQGAYVQTPQEESGVRRLFIDRAASDGLEYVSLVRHPWSLGRFDPPMRMLELVFDRVVRRGMTFARLADLRKTRD